MNGTAAGARAIAAHSAHAPGTTTDERGRPLTRGARRWRRALLVAGAGLLLLAAFTADVLTGNEVSSSLDYVVAVAFAAWFLGTAEGVGAAALSSGAWLLAYLAVGTPFSHTRVLVWNLIAETSIYVALAVSVGALRTRLDQVRSLAGRLMEANQALVREARAVGRLQQGLLPSAPPALPGFAWSVHYETSTRAGGDDYDFFELADGRVAMLVADASGHGAPAAVLMAMMRAVTQLLAGAARSPDELLAGLNRELSRMLPSGWFVTACVVILDPDTGAFDYSLAGHDPPLIVRAANGAPESLAALGGPMLGPFPGMPFLRGHATLERGDTLVLYTDGLTEAADAAGRLLGVDAVRADLEGAAGLAPDAIRDRLLARVERHRSGAPASDDLTLVILGRSG